MRVLMLHNRYRRLGGEDLVAASEARMLRAHGVEVLEVDFDNDAAAPVGPGATWRLGLAAAWSEASYRRILKLCGQYRPHVAHVHNFWMKLSPSVHAACRAAGAATVQTLHNFRLLCVNAQLLRNGRVCEDCLGKVPWRGVLRRCYRGSFLPSAAVARMLVSNRKRGTWERDVDAFIALSEHCRSKFIAGNLPADRIFVKPNFVEDPGPALMPSSASDLVLCAGRLSKEKGVSILLSSWAQADLSRYGRLLIVGDGPEREALENQAASLGLSHPKAGFIGQKAPDEVLSLIATSRVVVIPSVWYEAFPRVLMEAFSQARPVVVSDLGALAEIVHHGRTGLKFAVGDTVALSRAIKSLLTNDGLAGDLGQNARREYVDKYTPERNYQILTRIYRFALERRGHAVPEALAAFEPAEAGMQRGHFMGGE